MSEDDGSADAGSTDDGSTGVMDVARQVVPDFVRKRFALKFVLVLLVIGGAIMAIGLVATATIAEETDERVQNEYRNLAGQEANLVEQWVETNRLTTRGSSGDDDWLQDDTRRIERSLLRTQTQDMPFDSLNLHLINRTSEGSFVVGSSRDQVEPGTPVTETPFAWTTEPSFDRNNQVNISDVYRTVGDEPVVGFMSPVVGAEDRYLVQEVGLSSVTADMRGNASATGGFTQVVHEDGTVQIDERRRLADAEDATLQSYGDDAAREPLRAAVERGNRPGVIARMDGTPDVIDRPYTVGYVTVEGNAWDKDWVVLVHAPRGEVFGFVQTVSDWGLFATVASVLVLGLMGALLGYSTSTSIDRLRRKAEEMERGNLEVEIHSDRIDNIGRLYDGFASMRDALAGQIEEAEQARKEAEVSRAEAMEMNEYLQETAEEYSETMQACARGDLTQRMQQDGENEAMDQIAEDFNDMISELEMTTGQLKTFAEDVEEGGRSVKESAEAVREASEQVADSVQKISDDAYDQTERLEAIAADIDGVVDQLEAFADEHDVDVEETLAAIRAVADAVDDAAHLGEETMTESENVASAAEEQAAELNEVSARAEELTRYAQYLGDGLGNFETEEEHEFVFQTGASETDVGSPDDGEESAE